MANVPQKKTDALPPSPEVMHKAHEMIYDRFRFCHEEHPIIQKIRAWSLDRYAHSLMETGKK